MRTTPEVLSLFVVLALVNLVSSQCSSHSDGCSIPYSLPYFYKKSFTPACDRHDICYSCGSSRGMDKRKCDIKLYREATSVCGAHAIGKRLMDKRSVISNFCVLVSKSYYEAVKLFGASHFTTSSPSWCSQSWVTNCLS